MWPDGLARLCARTPVPVVALGGVTSPDRAAACMAAADPRVERMNLARHPRRREPGDENVRVHERRVQCLRPGIDDPRGASPGGRRFRQGCGPHGAACSSFTSCVITSGRNLLAKPTTKSVFANTAFQCLVVPPGRAGMVPTLSLDYSIQSIVGNVGIHVTPDTFCYAVWKLTIAQVAPVLPFLLLVLILIVRPRGLMGTREG